MSITTICDITTSVFSYDVFFLLRWHRAAFNINVNGIRIFITIAIIYFVHVYISMCEWADAEGLCF